MINISKITKKTNTAQIAGLLPNDSNIEFFGHKSTKSVFWLSKGKVQPWSKLPNFMFQLCLNQLNNDKTALNYLQNLEIDLNRQVELYIYHLYGDLDAMPDIFKGQLTISENFRDENNTPALLWETKRITLNGKKLTPRDLKIIDFILNDVPDKAIASEMKITQPTLDFHKRNLYKRAHVVGKTSLIIDLLNQHV